MWNPWSMRNYDEKVKWWHFLDSVNRIKEFLVLTFNLIFRFSRSYNGTDRLSLSVFISKCCWVYGEMWHIGQTNGRTVCGRDDVSVCSDERRASCWKQTAKWRDVVVRRWLLPRASVTGRRLRLQATFAKSRTKLRRVRDVIPWLVLQQPLFLDLGAQ